MDEVESPVKAMGGNTKAKNEISLGGQGLGLKPRVMMALIIALTPFFLLLELYLLERKAEAEDAARQSAKSILSIIVERYRDQLELAGETLFLISRAEEVKTGRWNRVRALLKEIHLDRPQFDDLGVLDPKGNLLVSAVPPPSPLNVADREYFKRALSTRRLVVSGFLESRLTGNRIIMFALPVTDEFGAVKMVLVAPLNLDFLNRMFSELDLPRGCEVMVTDADGVVLIHQTSGKDVVGREVKDEELKNHLKKSKAGSELRTSGGKIYFLAQLEYPNVGANVFHLVLGYREEDIFGPARSDFIRNLIVLSLVTLTVFLFAIIYLDRTVLRPLKRLVEVVERTGEELPEREQVRELVSGGFGEIKTLGKSFMEMLERISAREVERDRALERAERLGRFYAMLSSTNRAIVHSRDESELLLLICKTVVEEGGFLLAWVGRLEEREGRVEVLAGHGAIGYLSSLNIKVWEGEESRGPTGTALREGRPVVCHDIATDPLMAPWRERALAFGFRSSCALPLRRKGRVWGTLNVYSAQPGYFNEEEIAILEEMAEDLSYALGALDEEEARKRGEENLRLMVQTLLNLGPEPTSNVEMILDLSLKVIDASLAKYLRRKNDRYSLVAVSSVMDGYSPTDQVMDASLVESRLLWHNGMVSESLGKEELMAQDPDIERWGLKSLLGFPVFIRGDIQGVLCLYRKEEREFSRDEVDLAGMLAKTISVEEERWEHEESIRDFLEIASHELRHPITVLKGYSLTLLKHGDRLAKEEIEEIFREISSSADRMDVQLRDLLDLGRVERLGVNPAREKVRVEELVRGAVEETSERHRGREFRFQMESEELTGWLDPRMTKQILIFLLDNACKFSPPETPVEVSVAYREGELQFSVLDRGRGIPEWDRERIFERFYQVEEVIHHSTPGLGLGLYLAKRLVEAQGGRIWCLPREGGGSVFTFALPQEAAAKGMEQQKTVPLRDQETP